MCHDVQELSNPQEGKFFLENVPATALKMNWNAPLRWGAGLDTDISPAVEKGAVESQPSGAVVISWHRSEQESYDRR